MNKEIRTLTSKIELRAEPNGGQTTEYVEGYALKFNTWSEVMGMFVPFREKLDPGCLDGCDMSDVRCLFNHDANMPLGRNTVTDGPGSLEMDTDNIGQKFKCNPTDTSYGRDLKENIRAGVVNQCSFAFTLSDDDDAETIEFNENDGIYERTINKIAKLYDVSPVTYPAYPDTEAVVGQRSLDKIKEMDRKRSENSQKNSLDFKKKRLDLLKKTI